MIIRLWITWLEEATTLHGVQLARRRRRSESLMGTLKQPESPGRMTLQGLLHEPTIDLLNTSKLDFGFSGKHTCMQAFSSPRRITFLAIYIQFGHWSISIMFHHTYKASVSCIQAFITRIFFPYRPLSSSLFLLSLLNHLVSRCIWQ